MSEERSQAVEPVAPLLDRFGADAFDYILVGLLISMPVIIAVQGSAVERGGLAIAVAQGLIGLYEVACVALWGKTIGRRVSHTVVRRASDGGPVGWWRSVVRWSVKLLVPVAYTGYLFSAADDSIDAFVRAGQLVVVASIFLDSSRRGWHDKVAGTVVLSER